MPFMIVANDAPGVAELRAKVRPAHIAYLEANLDKIVAAGAMLADDGKTAIGSLYLIDTDHREEAEQFIRHDPYMQKGVFAGFEATRWRKGVFDGRSFIKRA